MTLTMNVYGPMHGMGGRAAFKKFAPADARRSPADEEKACTAVAASALFLGLLSSAIEPRHYDGGKYHSGQRQHNEPASSSARAALKAGTRLPSCLPTTGKLGRSS